jgi:hypothetical protein
MASRAPATQLTLARTTTPSVWYERDWQQLWLSTQQQRSWRSLALVPASAAAPPTFVLQVALALSRVGGSHLGASVHVADGEIELDQLIPFGENLKRATSAANDRVLIAMPSLRGSVTAMPVVQMADSCLLCVLQGVDTLREVKGTIDRIGTERIVGAAMFRPGS